MWATRYRGRQMVKSPSISVSAKAPLGNSSLLLAKHDKSNMVVCYLIFFPLGHETPYHDETLLNDNIQFSDFP